MNVKETVASAANTVADAAKNLGHKIAENASDAAAYVKDKAGIGCDAKGASDGVSGIKEHMKVFASCGKQVGVVDHLEGSTIKLTKNDSPDGQHHFIPTTWVGRVHDNHVHLSKNSVETESGWKNDAVSCASCSA